VWPDEPWWKLSGLFDLLTDESVQAGVADLEAAMAEHGNDHLLIYGESGGAFTVNKEKRKLAAQYPPGTTAPDIEFVLQGDPNVPNGGLNARFPGLPTVILGTFDGPEPTDTPFHTDVINRQYDGAADFPLYVLNPIADLNAVLGFLYVHTHAFDVSLPANPTTSTAYQGTHGDSSYYLFPTPDLPLFAPLRQLGVPEGLIDVVEPFFRVLVELGYDRSIPPWEPTPARLIPPLDPAKITTDLVNAIGEGVNNALALVGSPALSSVPAPVLLAAPATTTAKAGISPQVTSSSTPTQTEQAASTGAETGTRQISTDTMTPTTNATETAKADVSPQVAPTELVTETDPPTSAQSATDTEQLTSPKKVTETTKATSTPTSAVEPPATSAPEHLTSSALMPKPTKTAGQPAKLRPLVRDSHGEGQQLPGRSHREEGDRPTTPIAAAGADSSTASSAAASSSTGSSSRGGSSGGDGDGS
jgi:hypothetical protein